MATTLKNTVIKNVGSVPILLIETPLATRVTVLGLSITNVIESPVLANLIIEDDTSVSGFYLKDSIIPVGTSLRAVSTGEKLVLAPQNRLLVSTNFDDAVDVIVSYVEIT